MSSNLALTYLHESLYHYERLSGDAILLLHSTYPLILCDGFCFISALPGVIDCELSFVYC